VHHVGILYGQFMMHGQRNIKLIRNSPQNHAIYMYYNSDGRTVS